MPPGTPLPQEIIAVSPVGSFSANAGTHGIAASIQIARMKRVGRIVFDFNP